MPDTHIFLGNYSPGERPREEFEEWWPIHVREVVDNIEGFVGATRYRIVPKQREWSPPARWECLMVYELEGDDVDAIHRDNTRVRESNIYTPYDGMMAPGRMGHVYTPIGTPYRLDGWSGRDAASHIVVVRTNPSSPEDEDRFNEWYDTHLQEVVDGINGYAGAQRYRLNASQRPGMVPAPWQYVTIYEVDDTDLADVYASHREFKQQAAFKPHGGLVKDDHVGHVYAPVAARITKALA